MKPLPQVPADVLTADEQADVRKALQARLAPHAADAEGWRRQLTGLTPPGDTPEAAALHTKLLAARNAPLDTGLRTAPPQTRTAAADLSARLDALGGEKVGGRTLAEWKTATAEDHAAYTRLRADAESARKGNLAQFADRVRAAAKSLCAAATEAAGTKGFDADDEAVKEVRKTLHARRKEVRDAVGTLALIDREVTATTPPDRTRLAELQAMLRDLTVPDAEWCRTTAPLALRVADGAKAVRLEFDSRRKVLGGRTRRPNGSSAPTGRVARSTCRRPTSAVSSPRKGGRRGSTTTRLEPSTSTATSAPGGSARPRECSSSRTRTSRAPRPNSSST